VIQPKMVVTLGRVALEALRHIADHKLNLVSDAGVPVRWEGRWLVPLYHPGSRARVHRPLERQLEDFVVVKGLLDSLKKQPAMIVDVR
jgi:uracil-DNA glycosylase